MQFVGCVWIANLNSADVVSILFLTTSQVEARRPAMRRDPDGFHELAPESYSWVLRATVLNLTQPRMYDRVNLLADMQNQKCFFHGMLSPEDLKQINQKLRKSLTLTGAVLRKIVVET